MKYIKFFCYISTLSFLSACDMSGYNKDQAIALCDDFEKNLYKEVLFVINKYPLEYPEKIPYKEFADDLAVFDEIVQKESKCMRLKTRFDLGGYERLESVSGLTHLIMLDSSLLLDEHENNKRANDYTQLLLNNLEKIYQSEWYQNFDRSRIEE